MLASVMVASVSVCGAQEAVHRGIAVSPTVSMRVFVPAGSVRIAVWNRDSIDVTGTVGATASMFGGGNREYAKFGIEPLRTGDAQLPVADLVITVPRRAHVWVKMTTGTIDCAGTEGELELYTVGGSITVRNASGVSSVEAIDAAVSVLGSRGDIRVRGGKATIVLQDVSGTASVTSISGGVNVRGVSAPEGRIETIGGDITLDVPRLRSAALDLQTHSGAITVVVDQRALPVLDLASRTGVVTNNAPKGMRTAGLITARSFRGAISIRVTDR
jgi:DUF4097 and DUF4098 domain-containing protein YvlB